MEKTGYVKLSKDIKTVGVAAEILYKQLPSNYVPQSVRVVVTTANGLEITFGAVIPLNVGTIGTAQSPRPVLHPVDFELAPVENQADMVYLTFSVEA